MRRARAFAILILFWAPAIHAEQQISQNIFLNNGSLFARGANGAFQQFVFNASAQLVFGGQLIADANPIVDQVLGFYCRTLDRTSQSSLRFRFFVRALSSRLNQPGAQACLRNAENLVNNSPPTPARGLFKDILAQGQPLIFNGSAIQPDSFASGLGGGGASTSSGGGNSGGGFVPQVPGGVDPRTGDITPDGGATGITPGHANPGDPEVPQPGRTQNQSPPRPEADGDKQLFCTDPKKAICDEAARNYNTPGADFSRDRRQFFDGLLAIQPPISRDNLRDSSPTRERDWMTFINRLTSATASRERFLNSGIADWKSKVIARISASGAPDTNGMINAIRAIDIFNMADLVKQGKVSLSTLLSYCGSDGLGNGGFNNRRFIAMCPAQYSSLQSNEGFEHTLLHELGHSVDGEIFKNSHQAFEDCLRDARFNSFRDELGVEADERQAEVNAAETAALSVKNQTPAAALRTIARIVGHYCPNVGGSSAALEASSATAAETERVFNPGGKARHFSSNVMISILWGRNADLREKMGCPRASENLPMCTLRGKVTR